MPLGPVFHAELLTTARRARYFALRVVYALLLLLVLWSAYDAARTTAASLSWETLTIRETTRFARDTFGSFATLQFLTILLLSPALVAPVIASEKSRKTFHYLLASHLTSAEIVLGKLGSRLLLLGVTLAVGLPIFSLLSMFGGVEPGQIAVAYAMLGGLLLFMGGQAILVSTLTTDPRRAIFYGYAIPAGVWVAPHAFILLFGYRWPGFADACLESLSRVWPLPRVECALWSLPGFPYRERHWGLAEQVEVEPLRIALVWALRGVGFVVAANLMLRPVGRREERRSRLRLGLDSRGRIRMRVIPRPACGDDAMLWKECHTSRSGGTVRLLGLMVNLFVLTFVGLLAATLTFDSIGELFAYGYGGFDAYSNNARAQFAEMSRTLGGWVLGVWMVGAAATAASSVTSEREGDTWVSLLSTPLTAREIVRAKLLGAVLRFRLLGLTLLIFLGVATLVGALHPSALAIGVLEIALFVGIAATIGVVCSLESGTTTRALAMTLVALFAVNVLFLGVAWSLDVRDPRFARAGVGPLVLTYSMPGYAYGGYGPDSSLFENLPILALVMPFYGLALFGLYRWAIVRFDMLNDRPATEPDRETDLPASERRTRYAS